ncbi:MAG TPA: alpha/beta fold hydrolase [Baekduia sp.]|nr:alpha/beta fold hydrolase [Baekduia sp.]
MAPTLNVERTGSGAPLVLLHGIGSELCVWEPVLEPLGEHREVLAVDLPGFGRSAPLSDEVAPTPGALARAVASWLDVHGLERVHVAGNSLGGWVALELAKLGRARTVTCLSPAGLWGRPLTTATVPQQNPARRAAKALSPVVGLLMLSARARRLALMNFVAHPERVPRRAAARMVSSYARASAYEATSLAMRSSHLQGAERIDVPVTVGWGERDRLLRPAPLRAPLTQSLVLPGCGHVPMWDDTPLVTRVLLDGSARQAA